MYFSYRDDEQYIDYIDDTIRAPFCLMIELFHLNGVDVYSSIELLCKSPLYSAFLV